MALIFDGKIVSPVVTKEVAKTKFGLSIDNFIGDVDANGVLQAPTGDFVLDLTGLTKIGENGFRGLFAQNQRVTGVVANDVTEILDLGMAYAFTDSANVSTFEFNGLVEINVKSVFYGVNKTGNTKLVPHFNSLKSINGLGVFKDAFSSARINPDETFPVLEYVAGVNAFYNFRTYTAGEIITFSTIKTIVGSKATYDCIFGSIAKKNIVWNFPSATSFTGYIWNSTSSYPGEIHFAAANQAAIEACSGYANKWGFAGATIYFDL